MTDTLSNKPAQKPSNLDALTQQLSAARNEIVKNGANNAANQLQNAQKFLERATDELHSSTKESLDFFKKEMEAWKSVAESLPDTATELKETITRTTDELYTYFQNNTIPFAQNTAKNANSFLSGSGFGTLLDKASKTMETVGTWLGELWNGMKPHLAKVAAMPGIQFFIGKEKMNMLHSWLGYSPDMLQMQAMITQRLPENVSFSMTNKREALLLNDKYTLMLSKKNADNKAYSKEVFMAELMHRAESTLIPTLNADPETGKKELFTTQLLTVADELIAEVTPAKIDSTNTKPSA